MPSKSRSLRPSSRRRSPPDHARCVPKLRSSSLSCAARIFGRRARCVSCWSVSYSSTSVLRIERSRSTGTDNTRPSPRFTAMLRLPSSSSRLVLNSRGMLRTMLTNTGNRLMRLPSTVMPSSTSNQSLPLSSVMSAYQSPTFSARRYVKPGSIWMRQPRARNSSTPCSAKLVKRSMRSWP